MTMECQLTSGPLLLSALLTDEDLQGRKSNDLTMQLMKAAGVGKAPASPAASPADAPTAPDDLFKVCPDRVPLNATVYFRMQQCVRVMLCTLP